MAAASLHLSSKLPFLEGQLCFGLDSVVYFNLDEKLMHKYSSQNCVLDGQCPILQLQVPAERRVFTSISFTAQASCAPEAAPPPRNK